MVPGVGVEPTQARGPRDFEATGERQRTKDLANSLPFSRAEESEEGRRVRGLWTPGWTPVTDTIVGCLAYHAWTSLVYPRCRMPPCRTDRYLNKRPRFGAGRVGVRSPGVHGDGRPAPWSTVRRAGDPLQPPDLLLRLRGTPRCQHLGALPILHPDSAWTHLPLVDGMRLPFNSFDLSTPGKLISAPH